MAPAKAPFAKLLAGVEVSPAAVPMLSSVTNRFVADPEEVRANLVNQLTDPVDYAGLIERLSGVGCNVFVECGPHQILSKLHRRLLGGREVVIASVDAPKRHALRQLANLRASLETAGVYDREDTGQIFSCDVPAGAVVETAASEPRPSRDEDRLPEADQRPRRAAPTEGAALRVIQMSGSPYEMGLAHGREYGEPIRRLFRRYADLAGDAHTLPDVTKQLADQRQFFDADELEEMRGVAEGAGVPVATVVAHNLMLYPDSGAGCAHFALTEAANPSVGMLHATNEDQPLALSARECLARCIQVRRPAGGIPHVVFSVVGQLAGINGMNAKGLAVSSAMLLDVPRQTGGERGLSQPALVNKILSNASDVATAVEIAREHCGAGGWSMCISSHDADQLTYLEYDGRSMQVRPDQFKVLAANHCMLHRGSIAPPEHSHYRLARLEDLFGNGRTVSVSVDQAKRALRDRFDLQRGREAKFPTMNTVRRVDNQVSLVMKPAEGKAWIADHSRSSERDEYVELDLHALLAEPSRSPEKPNGLPKPTGGAHFELSGEAASDALTQNGLAPARRDGAVCYRYVMRLIDSEAPAAPPRIQGKSVILGDNPFAAALQDRLTKLGSPATMLKLGDESTLQAALQDSDLASNAFLMHLFDEAEPSSRWAEQRRREVNRVFHWLQGWVERLGESERLGDARLIAATRLGGDLGLSGKVESAAGGALTGLLKSLSIELGMKTAGDFFARAVDVERSIQPQGLAELLVAEFGCDEREAEVAYQSGRRRLPRAVAKIAKPGEPARTPSGDWVVTGGARGVTAVVARELAERFGVRLHLLGSSPLPSIDPAWRNLNAEQKRTLRSQIMKEAVAAKKIPANEWARVEKAIEIDRNLRELNSSGLEFRYYVCDVSDRDSVESTLASIRSQGGEIRGVVHGAGFESALRFEKKKPELIERTFAVKVDGAANLMAATADDPIEHFAAFGSVSGRFGGIGQSDYAAANDMLSKLVDSCRACRPQTHAVTFHWHAWDEVGMAVRPESSHLRDIGDVVYMPTREGAEHFVDELLERSVEPEVVITGWPFHKLDPKYVAKFNKQPQRTPRPRPAARLRQVEAEPAPAGLPTNAATSPFALIDRVAEQSPGRSICCEIDMDPSSDAFLSGHVYKGRPLTPGVIAIEAMAQTAQQYAGAEASVIGLRDIRFIESQLFEPGKPRITRVTGKSDGPLLECQVTSDFFNRKGRLLKKDRLLYSATAELARVDEPLRGRAPNSRPESWHDFQYRDDLVIWHGDSLRCLKQIAVRGPLAWGRIVSLDPRALSPQREGEWILPAAAIDGAFYTCGVQVRFHSPGYAMIPRSIERLRWGRLPAAGERLIAFAACNEMDADRANFDFFIFGESGEPLVHAAGYEGVFVPQSKPA